MTADDVSFNRGCVMVSRRRIARRVGRVAAIAARGDKAFAAAVKKVAKDPVVRSALRAGARVTSRRNLLRAARVAARAGAKPVRGSVGVAATAASFVPGVGTGVAAALGAAEALASGKRISDVVLAAARNAVPGGPAARAAFDFAAGLARGEKVTAAALKSARAHLPGGAAARAAFDAGLAIGRGKRLQDAVVAAAGRALPASPYVATATRFVRSVATGSKIPDAALSAAGKQLIGKIERRGIDLGAVARGKQKPPDEE